LDLIVITASNPLRATMRHRAIAHGGRIHAKADTDRGLTGPVELPAEA
jgi:hypothetical protein